MTNLGMTSRGNWGNWNICPWPSIVTGVSTKSESAQGIGDDTALNGIRLKCESDHRYVIYLSILIHTFYV